YMASRNRRGGVPARDGEQRRDEPRREDQGEQQAPAPQGPVLPPPPPVDYGVFMQGLVQAMQTQAHTQAALQAQLEAQAQAPVPQAQDHGGPSIMERFKRMLPPSFKGERDPLLTESWMREIEKIFRAIRCAEDDKVTLATYMLQERADVWWSSLLRTRFEDGAVEVAFDHRTLDEARSTACRQEGEMEQYLEEKKASQKRPAAPFQRQERRAHGGTECWKMAGKCLKCGSSEHKIKDCPRLQQGVQRGPAPAAAVAAPVTGRPGRPRAPARVFALAPQLSIRSSVLDEVIEQQKADPRLQELVGKTGIARDEDGADISTSLEETFRSDSEREE
ncbi:hypothetical protein Taro_052180, partial [Colocasia esculenta]|nr:hypothetical protein [Colocasia esculenta]